MSRKTKDAYHEYVEHPRFGGGPRFTGLNPSVFDADISLGSEAISKEEFRELWTRLPQELFDELPCLSKESLENNRIYDVRRVAGTAILADQSKQYPRSYWRDSHYFDLDKICIDCKRPFLFFAEEQRHWFEVLGFSLDARCLRCSNCRKQARIIVQLRQSYDHLLHVQPRTQAQNLAMADIFLTLMEAGNFPATKTAQVRALLNSATRQSHAPNAASTHAEREALLRRILVIELGIAAKDKPVVEG